MFVNLGPTRLNGVLTWYLILTKLIYFLYMMKLKCDFVSVLLVATNGRTVIPIEKARDEKKRSPAWC